MHADPELPQSLCASRMSSPIFSHFVGPRRSQHFDTLRLDRCQDYAVGTALLGALAWSNITDLTIEGAWYNAIIGPFADFTEPAVNLRLSAIPVARMLRQIVTLRFLHVEAGKIQCMLPCAIRLEALHLTTSSEDNVHMSLGKILANVPHLHEFHLECESAQPSMYDQFDFGHAVRELPDRAPHLRQFSYAGEVSPTSLEFAALFSNSLQRLTIRAIHDDDENEGPPFPDKCFAALTHLEVSGSIVSSWPILESLVPRNVPNLRTLIFEPPENLEGLDDEAGHVLDQISNLRKASKFDPGKFTFHVHLRDDTWSATDRAFAAEYGMKHDLCICLSCDQDMPSFGWSDRWNPPVTAEASSSLAREVRGDVKRTLLFLKDLEQQLEASSTPSDWSRLAELLRAAEFERSVAAM